MNYWGRALLILFTSTAIARGLAESPPKGIDLSGNWQLNAALSDDVEKIMAERRTYLQQRFDRERHTHRRNTSPDDDLYNPPLFILDKDFAQPFKEPAHIAISQSGSHFLIKTTATNGDVNADQYEAGTRSVTSFGAGFADRDTGWRDKAFVISLRAAGQDARKEERYSLGPNGRLVIVTAFSGGDLPKVEIKSVYDRAAATS
jgi:hypothetical protein